MLTWLRHRAIALLALLALALGATGLAHRAPSVAEEELASYMRAGLVSLDDICGMAGMGAAAADCPLCRVDPGYLPPAPAQDCLSAEFASSSISPSEAGYPPPTRPAPVANGPRAPPVA